MMGAVFSIYNLGATLAIRRFVATYRKHVIMLGLFVFMVLFTLTFLVTFALRTGETEGPGSLTEDLTPGSLATVAFALLFVRGLVDVHRSVVKDRALWSMLVSPLGEGRVRAGLMLRTAVFQMGLLALVMGTFAMVLLVSPDKPYLPWETGPLIVLSGLAAATLPLPVLLSALGWRKRAHKVALVALLGTDLLFSLLLQMDVPLNYMLVAGLLTVAISLVVTLKGAPVLATVWATYDSQRYRPSGQGRKLPPLFSLIQRPMDPVGRALFRREMVMGYNGRQRVSFAGLNVVMAGGLVVVNSELGVAMKDAGFGGYYENLVTPFMVGLGIYALAFFQATMPLVDGVTREGPAIWVLRSSPVEPHRFLSAKARPLLAFMPLTMLAAGFAIPFMAGRGWEAMLVGMLGAGAVYLAFIGVGAYAGAIYPNLDRHSNAPPDLVVAFYLMFGCLILTALLLGPVMVISFLHPPTGIAAAAFALLIGWLIMFIGIRAGGKALGKLQVA
jgi:hypothetical protein